MTNFMQDALKEAKKAEKKGEVPIGAVIVVNNKVISKGHNMRERKQNALLHAEIIAINKACKKLHSWRLENATMFVTLEPCPMCAGAIANARIAKVVYAAKDKTAEDNLCEKICSSTRLNHKVELVQGDYQKEAEKLLQDFFKSKRNKKGA